MKPTRQIWIWALVEILVALFVRWLLLEAESRFARTRAWYAGFTGRKPHQPNPPPPDVRNPFATN